MAGPKMNPAAARTANGARQGFENGPAADEYHPLAHPQRVSQARPPGRKQNRTPLRPDWSLGGAGARGHDRCASSASPEARRGPIVAEGLHLLRSLSPLSLGDSCDSVPDCLPLKLARNAHRQAASPVLQPSVLNANRSGAVVRLERPPFPYRVVTHGRGFSPLPGRGGARNKPDRVTTALSERDAGKLLEAKDRALRIGLPFNRFTTVHWEAAGVADDLKATGRLLKLMGDWLRSRGRRAAFVWVRENGLGKGAHVHILLHLPPELADSFNACQRGWLKACGAQWRKGVLKTRSIGRSYRQALGGGQDYLTNLAEVVDYLLKGADHRARERFGIKRSDDGGTVAGKRCGVSQSLGPTALKRQRNAKDFGKSGGLDGEP